jgi:hypothetical protein
VVTVTVTVTVAIALSVALLVVVSLGIFFFPSSCDACWNVATVPMLLLLLWLLLLLGAADSVGVIVPVAVPVRLPLRFGVGPSYAFGIFPAIPMFTVRITVATVVETTWWITVG